MESIATEKALKAIRPNKRQFILSRANFPGSGVHSVHWNGIAKDAIIVNSGNLFNTVFTQYRGQHSS